MSSERKGEAEVTTLLLFLFRALHSPYPQGHSWVGADCTVVLKKGDSEVLRASHLGSGDKAPLPRASGRGSSVVECW